MTTLWQDVLYGFRMLVKKPGFTVVAAVSLALGIGANTVIFSLINNALLRPLPFRDPDRLLSVYTVPENRPNQRNSVNVPSYFAWAAQNQSFESFGGFFYTGANAGADQNGAPPEALSGLSFTPSLFATLGLKPALGRVYTEEEGKVDSTSPAMLISQGLWQRRFNGDRGILGRTMRLDDVPVTIVGVLPSEFTSFFGEDFDYVASHNLSRVRAQSAAGLLQVVGRLKEGVSIQQAQAEMSSLAAALAVSDPDRNKGNGARVLTLQEYTYGQLRPTLLMFQGAVAFVLLIACANVAGLLLARAASRRTELAVRSAIGAGRGRIVRQMLTESVLLAAIGGIAGTGLAWAGLRLFVASAPPRMLPHIKEIGLDPQVLAFTALVVVVTGLLFGIVPAMQASRTDLTGALKDSSRSASSGIARHRFRSALVTVQIGLALVLLIGAGLMINSFVRLQPSDLGVEPHGLLVFDFRFAPAEVLKVVSRYRGVGLWEISPKASMTFDRVLEGVRRIPGVTSAAGSTMPPLQGAISMNFLIEGRPAPPPETAGGAQQSAAYTAITSNYFKTMKIPILRGRDFDDRDNLAGNLVVIVNQSMAKRFWPNEDPIGKRIAFDLVPNERAREIVAVVGDTRLSRGQRQPGPIVYAPHQQQDAHWVGPNLGPRAGMYFVLRTNGDPAGLIPSVRQAIAEVDRNKPLSYVRTVEQTLDQQVQYIRVYVLLLGVFGAIAAVLAASGIYGVMAYNVAQRTHEIGIRMALGASAGQVLGLVLRQAVVLIGIGLALGLAGSLALTRVIVQQLWGVTPTDPLTFACVSLFLAMVALAACFIPTRQAARVDPTVALRSE